MRWHRPKEIECWCRWCDAHRPGVMYRSGAVRWWRCDVCHAIEFYSPSMEVR